MGDKNAVDRNGLPVKRKEIYTYDAPWMTYGLSWCRSREDTFRLAVGSFKEEYSNQIEIIQLYKDDKGVGTFKKLTSFEHPYPATKLMWAPPTLPNAEKVPTLLPQDLLSMGYDAVLLRGFAFVSHHTHAIMRHHSHLGPSSLILLYRPHFPTPPLTFPVIPPHDLPPSLARPVCRTDW
jgi:hypothetical protein